MRFVDEVELILVSGNGGAGCVSFRREKYMPLGGPDGGDGGHGGAVIVQADDGMGSLMDMRHRKIMRAKNGIYGMGNDKSGKRGEPIIIPLPVGTLVIDTETDELMADLTYTGQTVEIIPGGLGGRGNARFKTPTDRAPTYAQPGTPGIEKRVRLELKLMADVGLLGFPNAGKSTLISRISAARPKIADYPFTTLVPNLGVVAWGDDKSYVVADIPGLIEGASKGVGLGIQFLKHVERTRLLLHLVDPIDDRDPIEKYKVLRRELEAFDPEIAERPECVVITKMDVTEAKELMPLLEEEFGKFGCEIAGISAVTGEGIKELVLRVGLMVEELHKADAAATGAATDGG